MKIKIKNGDKITPKEFVSRWKEGINGINPLQQTQMSYKSTWIMCIGLASGLFLSFGNFKSLWWLSLILAAGLFNTLIVQVGNYQKIQTLKNIFQKEDLD